MFVGECRINEIEDYENLYLYFITYFTCQYFRDASMMSMRKKIAGLRPDQIRQLPKEELDLPVSAADFDEAVERCNKSVSQEDLEKYEKWMSEFGSS